MATCKLNADQFANQSQNSAGIVFVYQSTNKETKTVTETAQHFFGDDFEMQEKSENELFRVWKNVVATFWAVKAEEQKLRVDNDGIRSKLRASTPARIRIVSKSGEIIKNFDLEQSVWQRIGLVPTKTDLERNDRNWKKSLHKASIASFNALEFRVEVPKEIGETVPQTEGKGKGKGKKTEEEVAQAA